jgi:hypothetical protein
MDVLVADWAGVVLFDYLSLASRRLLGRSGSLRRAASRFLPGFSDAMVVNVGSRGRRSVAEDLLEFRGQ